MTALRYCGSQDAHGPHEWEGGHCVGLTVEDARIPPRRIGGYVQLAPETITWGATLCSRKACAELAAVAMDGWPLCIIHADDELERWVALAVQPDLARLMPDLEDE